LHYLNCQPEGRTLRLPDEGKYIPDVPQNTSLGFFAVGSGIGDVGGDDSGEGKLLDDDSGKDRTRVDVTICVD